MAFSLLPLFPLFPLFSWLGMGEGCHSVRWSMVAGLALVLGRCAGYAGPVVWQVRGYACPSVTLSLGVIGVCLDFAVRIRRAKGRRARDGDGNGKWKGKSVPAWRTESQWFGVILSWLCTVQYAMHQLSNSWLLVLDKHVHSHDRLTSINVEQHGSTALEQQSFRS